MADGSNTAPATPGRVKHESLALAFVAAQAEFEDVVRDKVNPHLRSKYATLDGVIDAVRPALNRHGLALLQPPRHEGNDVIVDTIIVHAETGDKLMCSLRAATLPLDMQKLGANLTYIRRYSLLGLMGLFPGEDDDGNGAAAPGRPAQNAQARPNNAPQSSYGAKRDGEHLWADKAIAELRGPGDADDLRASERWQSLPRSWRDAYEDKIEARLEALAKHMTPAAQTQAREIEADEPPPAAEAGFGERLFDVVRRDLLDCQTPEHIAAWTANLTANASKFTDDERAALRKLLKERKTQVSGDA